MKFTELNLKPAILKALDKMGYTDLTPIQEAAFIPVMSGKDLVGVAETGSGKTSACAIPVVQRIDPTIRGIQGLILVPTRELALQYMEEIARVAEFADISCFAIYGGFSMSIQEAKFKEGVQILVATPGRLIDFLYKSNGFTLSDVTTFVLDEADEMLKMGFLEDVQFILSCLVNKHQTLLFSATMATEIKDLIDKFLNSPAKIELTKDQKAPQTLEHYFKSINPKDKEEELIEYMATTPSKQIIIFCNSRQGVGDLHRSLRKKIKSIEMIHGGLDQMARTSIFNSFKEGKIKILIASDVAGRGLDFSRVTHVINYEMPREIENYTHRTGRAGRMGRQGTALTFITNRDLPALDKLVKENRIKMNWIGEEPDLTQVKRKKPQKRNFRK
jgi:ATP-dependent RNA helicase DeaD